MKNVLSGTVFVLVAGAFLLSFALAGCQFNKPSALTLETKKPALATSGVQKADYQFPQPVTKSWDSGVRQCSFG